MKYLSVKSNTLCFLKPLHSTTKGAKNDPCVTFAPNIYVSSRHFTDVTVYMDYLVLKREEELVERNAI